MKRETPEMKKLRIICDGFWDSITDILTQMYEGGERMSEIEVALLLRDFSGRIESRPLELELDLENIGMNSFEAEEYMFSEFYADHPWLLMFNGLNLRIEMALALVASEGRDDPLMRRHIDNIRKYSEDEDEYQRGLEIIEMLRKKRFEDYQFIQEHGLLDYIMNEQISNSLSTISLTADYGEEFDKDLRLYCQNLLTKLKLLIK